MSTRRITPFRHIALAAGLSLSGSAWAGTPPWQVGKVSGHAWLNGQYGDHQLLALGDEIEAGATLVTDARARVMLVRGTESMVVGPGSMVAISEHPSEGLSTTVVEKAGSVTFDVERQNVQHFSVETPMLAAVVKGTHFTVSVNGASGGVKVGRGTVQVTALATGQTSDVTVGQRANVGGRGLSVAGPGPHAPMSQVAPRAPVVSSLPASVAPTMTVTSAELAAVASVPAASGAPSQGILGSILSAFMGSRSSSTPSAGASTAAGPASAGPSSGTARSAGWSNYSGTTPAAAASTAAPVSAASTSSAATSAAAAGATTASTGMTSSSGPAAGAATTSGATAPASGAGRPMAGAGAGAGSASPAGPASTPGRAGPGPGPAAGPTGHGPGAGMPGPGAKPAGPGAGPAGPGPAGPAGSGPATRPAGPGPAAGPKGPSAPGAASGPAGRNVGPGLGGAVSGIGKAVAGVVSSAEHALGGPGPGGKSDNGIGNGGQPGSGGGKH